METGAWLRTIPPDKNMRNSAVIQSEITETDFFRIVDFLLFLSFGGLHWATESSVRPSRTPKGSTLQQGYGRSAPTALRF
jgi:hypothetical protein